MRKQYRRPALQRLSQYLPVVIDVIPATATITVLCVMIMAVMLTIGEMQPSGPGADLYDSSTSSSFLLSSNQQDAMTHGANYATGAVSWLDADGDRP